MSSSAANVFASASIEAPVPGRVNVQSAARDAS